MLSTASATLAVYAIVLLLVAALAAFFSRRDPSPPPSSQQRIRLPPLGLSSSLSGHPHLNHAAMTRTRGAIVGDDAHKALGYCTGCGDERIRRDKARARRREDSNVRLWFGSREGLARALLGDSSHEEHEKDSKDEEHRC